MGLSISKKIMEGLGGTLDVISEVGVGTAFILGFEAQKIRGSPSVSSLSSKDLVETRRKVHVRQVDK